MIDTLRLLVGVGLPWLAGYALVRAITYRLGRANGWVEAGYGHFVGILLVTLMLRVNDALGVPLAAMPVGISLALVAAAAWWLAGRERAGTASTALAERGNPRAWRWVTLVAVTLIALRIGTLAADVLLRPLFAWDAWSQWATKAKVWSALRDIVPFIGYEEWLAGQPGYTDTAPSYPATIPLLQTWMTLTLGRWDDSLMNVPWLAGFVALGLAVFGMFRQLAIAVPWAALATYLVLSLPLLDAHVALAGYADFHIAAAYTLAVLALAHWERSRAWNPAALLALAAVMLPLLKIPGIAWLGTLGLGAVIVLFGTTPWRMLLLGTAVLGCTIAAGWLVGSSKAIVDAASTQYRVVESLVLHLFAFANWHLLWYLLPLVVALAWREAIALKATSITLLFGFAFLVWTFLFTQAGDWVVDYTTVNRALLHMAPAATAYGALLAILWASRRVDAMATPPAKDASAGDIGAQHA